MPRQFGQLPTLGEFVERAKRFGVKRKHTPTIADGPRGSVRFYYLQCEAGQPFVVLDDMPNSARLTRNQVRSYCAPEELLDVIEAKGREVSDAIAALRTMLNPPRA